jgi:hypothetical protein
MTRLPSEIMLHIFNFINITKHYYIVQCVPQIPSPLGDFLKHTITIQKWYRTYKLPRTIINSQMSHVNAHDMYKIWSNKYYIMRLILAYYDRQTLLNYPELCIRKLSRARNYNHILNKINANIYNLPSLNVRKPSDVRGFISNTILDAEIMNYIGY